jgi:CrcB protein
MSEGLRFERDQDDPVESPGTRLEFAAIALGGAIGACLRRAAYLPLANSGEGALWPAIASTLAINVMGALALGALLSLIESRTAHPLLRPFLAVGVLGTFTTYSTMIFENGAIASEIGPNEAVLHLLLSITLGWTAFAIGHRIVDRFGERVRT